MARRSCQTLGTMTTQQVLTNNIAFRWDAETKRLVVTDAKPIGGGPPRSIAEVEYGTLKAMSFPDASRFIGEFVTLLMPELRTNFSAEFGREQQSGGEEEAVPSFEDLAEIQRATASEVAAIDTLIFRACSPQWRKVAMVAGTLLNEFDSKFAHLPFVFIQVRISELARAGQLEVRGNVMKLRASEVRLANSERGA